MEKIKKMAHNAGATFITVISVFVLLISLSVYADAESISFDHIGAGDCITFGSYEQDNDLSNGKEPLEWYVLAKEDDKMLLISRYAVDFKPYNDEKADVMWEDSSLHIWINNIFPQDAFTSEEMDRILNTNISADESPKYSAVSEKTDGDKIFMLSIDEANKYFEDNEARKCVPTAYARSKGISVYEQYTNAAGENTCWWWLRAPGSAHYNTAFVTFNGSVYTGGEYVRYDAEAVRPAMWISTE